MKDPFASVLDPSSRRLGSALCSWRHSATVPASVPPEKNTACAPLFEIFSTSPVNVVLSVTSRPSSPATLMPRPFGVPGDDL